MTRSAEALIAAIDRPSVFDRTLVTIGIATSRRHAKRIFRYHLFRVRREAGDPGRQLSGAELQSIARLLLARANTSHGANTPAASANPQAFTAFAESP